MLRSVCLAVLVAAAAAQPPPGGGGDGPPGGGPPGGGGNMGGGSGGTGESTATNSMCNSGTTCKNDGSTNFVERALTYADGKFSGSITSNLCPNKAASGMIGSASCIKQTFPDPSFTTTPAAAPGLGRAGMSLSGGVNIYGPLEAGFSMGMACSNGMGDCLGGVDVGTCENELMAECGAANTKSEMFMDTCGGHASPYHFHNSLACEYTVSASTSHSPVIGVMLDGRGLYGKWEGDGATPSNLDACNGHMGPVPASSEFGTTAGTVYHYHVTDAPPYTVGCFGPVTSLDQCKGLYTECSATDNTLQIANTDENSYKYQQWCTCYQHNGVCNTEQFPGLCGGTGTLTVAMESGVAGGGASSASSVHMSGLLVAAMALLASIAMH